MPTVTFAKFAEHIGTSGAMVSKLRSQGVLDAALVWPEGAKRPVLDLDIALKSYKESQDPNYTSGTPQIKGNDDLDESTDESQAGRQSFIQARTWSERYRAADRKLNFEIRQGKWVLKADVKNKSFKAGRVLRDHFMNIPARCAAVVAAKSKKKEKEIYQLLRKEMISGLDECIKALAILGD
jgi:hypothetical protein